MGLKPCAQCGSPLKAEAAFCSSCGAAQAPRPPVTKRSRVRLLLVLVAILVVLSIAKSVISERKEAAPPSLPPATASDFDNLASVSVGGKCIAQQMRLQDAVMMYEGHPKWEFRWSEKMVTKTGMVASVLPRPGSTPADSPYLLQFSFEGTKKMGEARLVRIAWTGKSHEAKGVGLPARIGCKR
jgi:predicted nucleic acid-binding Zn ribbon protein